MQLKKYLFRFLCFFMIFVFIYSPMCFAFEDVYVWSNDYDLTVSTSSSKNSSDDANVDSNNSLNLESGCAILIE